MKRRTKKQVYWLKHVTAWQEQKCSGKTYAQANKIKLQYLYNWKSYFKIQQSKPKIRGIGQFARLVVTPPIPQAPVRLTFPNGICLEIASTPSCSVKQIIDQISRLS